MGKRIETIRLADPVAYSEGLAMQVARRDLVHAGRASDALYLLQHKCVLTLGRNYHEANVLKSRDELLDLGIEVCEAARGGDVTYHGPGQLVAYPILDLSRWQRSIRWYLRTLEDVVIDLLTQFGLEGERSEGQTGVWVGGAKVAAIGVGLRHWVTFHGLSLNVAPEMEHFGLIIPCGIADRPVISLRQLLGRDLSMVEAMDRFEHAFRGRFAG